MAGTVTPEIPKVFYIKRNDLSPDYIVDVFDNEGEPVNLAGATAVFSMKGITVETLKIDSQAATVEDGGEGVFNRLRYTWSVGDTDTSGKYNVEFQVSIGGRPRTYPSNPDQNLQVKITDDLNAA